MILARFTGAGPYNSRTDEVAVEDRSIDGTRPPRHHRRSAPRRRAPERVGQRLIGCRVGSDHDRVDVGAHLGPARQRIDHHHPVGRADRRDERERKELDAGPAGPAQRHRHRLGIEQHRLGHRHGEADRVALRGQHLRQRDPFDVSDRVEDDDALADRPVVLTERASQRRLVVEHHRVVGARRCRGATSSATSGSATAPVATTTTSGSSAATDSASASKPQRTSTPRRRHSPIRQRDQVDQLAPARQRRGERDLAAELLGPLDEGHAVPARRGHPRRLEAGRTAADDDHVPGRGGRRQRAELLLASDDRVRHARDRQALDQVPVAALVAADAAPDLLGPAGPRLVGPGPDRRSAPGRGTPRPRRRARGWTRPRPARRCGARRTRGHRRWPRAPRRGPSPSRRRPAVVGSTADAPCRSPTGRPTR